MDLSSLKGPNGWLVMFICNHCPYVKSIIDQIIIDTKELAELGVNSVGIMSNDPNEYEEDSFENMKKTSSDLNFPFPYLLDETQEVAKAFGAVCTPDFFVYDADHKLKYRGQMDASRPGSSQAVSGGELSAAINAVIDGRAVSEIQVPSIGCNIKWKAGNRPGYS